MKTVIYPDFLYIGVARAGSSWLYECLREHPEVFVPLAKDIEFFDNNYEKGSEWYLSFFKAGKHKKAVGELSHDYYLLPGTEKRIYQLLPDAKLICILREPVDKMISHYLFTRRLYPGNNIRFEDLISDTRKISRAENFALSTDIGLNIESVDYYSRLLPFYRDFPREHILVLFYDELKEDPSLFIAGIYDFLGVSSGFKPSALNERVNPASKARIPVVANTVYEAARIFRKLGFQNLVGWVKQNKFIHRLIHKEIKEDVYIPDSLKQKVKDFASRYYGELSELIGRPLPPGWFEDYI